MNAEAIFSASACEIADGIRARRLKSAEVLEVFLDRIARFDPDIRAFVEVDIAGSRQQAEKLDRLLAEGKDPGPLAGVPVAVKDLEDAKGLPTRSASLLSGDQPAGADSIQVRRLREAGAVIVGKTATPEFGSLAYTWSRAFGTTHNPWNLDRTPGGSSGGSAAAVAAGMVPLATGSDGGGSIRIPAAYCGLPGLKPTAGLVPAGIRRQVRRMSVLGTLARSPRDIARVLDQVSGPDPTDPFSLPRPSISFEELLQTECSRMATTRPAMRAVWSADLGFGWCDPEIEKIVRVAAEKIFDAGSVVEVDAPVELPDPSTSWLTFWALNAYTELREAWPHRKSQLTPVVAAVLELAPQLGAAEVADASHLAHDVFQRVNAIFNEADLILTPAMPSPAFPAEGPLPGAPTKPILDPAAPSRVIEAITGAEKSGIDPISGICFTFPFNLSGHPAISIPAGVDGQGTPVGLQIVGPRFSDLRLLALAQIMKEAFPAPDMPPRYTRGT